MALERNHYIINMPDGVEREVTADDTIMHEFCFAAGGVHFCKADRLICGILPADGVTWVMVGLNFRGNGIHMPYSPSAARELAAALEAAADQVEQTNTRASADQLAATLAKRGQANG
ncbi:hypothetical protein [Novosphingobium sp. FKTRR1]|uniref:hypothetical protein n=1 Tax=Novosphingobium sp. FKTRR1 TaxID=2879118 RepID=UPI001CF07D0A|nr:hypothetical protein [Novosphingobium sp. FKTRR1]